MNFSFINNYQEEDFLPTNQNNLYSTYNGKGSFQPTNYYDINYTQSENNWATEGSIQKSMMKSIHQPTPVGELFFSQENIDRIQKIIKLQVFKQTNGKYKLEVDQNESDLLIVMRDILITCAINEPYRIVHQVKALNHKVVQKILPGLITNLRQDDEYINQLDKPLDPIPLPVCMNSKGRLSLPSVTTTF